jgi:hypothetical protein
MGILSLLPPELITLLEWLVMGITACALILILSISIGKLLGDFITGLIGWIR